MIKNLVITIFVVSVIIVGLTLLRYTKYKFQLNAPMIGRESIESSPHRGYIAAAKYELKNFAWAQEEYFKVHQNYLTCNNQECYNRLTKKMQKSDSLEVMMKGEQNAFMIWTRTAYAPAHVFFWDSNIGSPSEKSDHLWPEK